MITSPERQALPKFHLVTDDAVLRRPDLHQLLRELFEAGGERFALHLRGPGLSGRELWKIAASARPEARRAGTTLLINDRLDIARAIGADGVQLGERSFSPEIARALLGPEIWIGASVHDPEFAQLRRREGADFLLAGTLYRSRTHPDRPGSGLHWIGELPIATLPVLGIGGITPDRVPAVISAGAYGIAAIGGVWHQPKPADALLGYLDQTE